MALGVVTGKAAPNTPRAKDGTRWVVLAPRFQRAAIGDTETCAWRRRRSRAPDD